MKIFDKNYTKDYLNEDIGFVSDTRSKAKYYLKKHLSKVRRRISKLFLKKEIKYE